MIPSHYQHFPIQTNSKGRKFMIVQTDLIQGSEKWINRVEKLEYMHRCYFPDDGSYQWMKENHSGNYVI